MGVRSDRDDPSGMRLVWQWNETDLSQFESLLEGSDVAAGSICAVAALTGRNYIRIKATSEAVPVVATHASTAAILPISGLPFNHAIFADIHHVSDGNLMVCRCASIEDALVSLRVAATESSLMYRYSASEVTAAVGYGQIESGANSWYRRGLGIHGDGSTNDVARNFSSAINAGGSFLRGQYFTGTMAGIGVTARGAAATAAEAYFSAIRVFEVYR